MNTRLSGAAAALATGGEGIRNSQARERQAHDVLNDHPGLLGGPGPRRRAGNWLRAA